MTKNAKPHSLAISRASAADVTVTAEELQAAEVIGAMLADPDWLMPLVAAQVQYRAVYYGLTAAALLEDVWTDALANWLLRHRPEVKLEKDVRGASAEIGDYELGGMPTSFKTGKGPTSTAVHWDATVESASTWTSPTALTYLSAEYGSLTGTWVTGDSTGPVRVVWPPKDHPPAHKVVALVGQIPGQPDTWRVTAVWEAMPEFAVVWAEVARLLAQDLPASSIEMLWFPVTTSSGDEGVLEFSAWPGVYLLPKSLLVDLPVSRNNRGTLITKKDMAQLLNAARNVTSTPSLFVRAPLWYGLYAPPRPPDLYLALRGSWDERFSPVSRFGQDALRKAGDVDGATDSPTSGE